MTAFCGSLPCSSSSFLNKLFDIDSSIFNKIWIERQITYIIIHHNDWVVVDAHVLILVLFREWHDWLLVLHYFRIYFAQWSIVLLALQIKSFACAMLESHYSMFHILIRKEPQVSVAGLKIWSAGRNIDRSRGRRRCWWFHLCSTFTVRWALKNWSYFIWFKLWWSIKTSEIAHHSDLWSSWASASNPCRPRFT